MVENSIFFSQKTLTEKLIGYITVCNGNGAGFCRYRFFLHGERLEVFMQNMVDALWVAGF